MVLFPPSVSHLWVHLTTCGSQSQGREPGDMSGDELVNQREDSWMAQSSKWDTGRGVVHLWQPRKNKIHCVPASWKPPLAQCYGLVAAGSKSAMRRPLPLPGCGGEWKETGRNLVCRDKGSLTEWQTKGTVATTIQIRRKHNTNRTTQRAALHDCRHKLPSCESVPTAPVAPHRNPAWRHKVWNTLLCLARLGLGQPTRLCPFLDSGEN